MGLGVLYLVTREIERNEKVSITGKRMCILPPHITIIIIIIFITFHQNLPFPSSHPLSLSLSLFSNFQANPSLPPSLPPWCTYPKLHYIIAPSTLKKD